jgi:hypothetical protein
MAICTILLVVGPVDRAQFNCTMGDHAGRCGGPSNGTADLDRTTPTVSLPAQWAITSTVAARFGRGVFFTKKPQTKAAKATSAPTR